MAAKASDQNDGARKWKPCVRKCGESDGESTLGLEHRRNPVFDAAHLKKKILWIFERDDGDEYFHILVQQLHNIKSMELTALNLYVCHEKTRPYFPLNTGWLMGIQKSWFMK